MANMTTTRHCAICGHICLSAPTIRPWFAYDNKQYHMDCVARLHEVATSIRNAPVLEFSTEKDVNL